MEPVSWSYLISNVSFPIAMVIFFIIYLKKKTDSDVKRDQGREAQALERERRLGERIDLLEDTHRKELIALLKEDAEMKGRLAQSMDRLSEIQIRSQADTIEGSKRLYRNIDRLVDAMEHRPCLGTLPRAQSPTGETTIAEQRGPDVGKPGLIAPFHQV